jgi:hypothetical protein
VAASKGVFYRWWLGDWLGEAFLLSTAFQNRQPGQVPADLQRLLTLGFSKFLIFGLMRDARERGKRLSDVVQATWHGLKRADRPVILRAACCSSSSGTA